MEPQCDALAEEDRKSFVWDDEFCDEVHPDDMAEIQERFQMYKDMLKRQKFARVRRGVGGFGGEGVGWVWLGGPSWADKQGWWVGGEGEGSLRYWRF